ncbi:MAG: hypothetical protein WDN46_00480 [Methylocella sp.]
MALDLNRLDGGFVGAIERFEAEFLTRRPIARAIFPGQRSPIAPPASAIVERPRGALLMAATEETFSIDNPAHLAAAGDILAALAPFEAPPWPPDAMPE